MEIIYTTTDTAEQGVADILKEKKHCAYINKVDKPLVGIPANLEYIRLYGIDHELCKQMGYVLVHFQHSQGYPVSQIGDLQLIHFGYCDNNFKEKFINRVLEWLTGKGLKVECVDNDLLIDNHKFCGIACTRYPDDDYQQTSIHLSINMNLEDIKTICKKPIVKVPIGLGEYGITTEEAEQMFISLCNEEG